MTPATRRWTDLRSQDARKAQLRRGAAAVAAARVAIGLAALVWPAVPTRPWVGTGTGTGTGEAAGAGSAELASRVFGRALGGRDLGLGLGALLALGRLSGEAEAEAASGWVAAGALADALDVATTLASWRELPRASRWLVIGSAAAASLTGAAGALALRSARPGQPGRPGPRPGAA
jgi:hypothetical protein